MGNIGIVGFQVEIGFGLKLDWEFMSCDHLGLQEEDSTYFLGRVPIYLSTTLPTQVWNCSVYNLLFFSPTQLLLFPSNPRSKHAYCYSP